MGLKRLDPDDRRAWSSPDRKDASCAGNVLLSILLTSIFRRAFVVSLALGLRLDRIFTMKAELTAENKPA